MANQEASRTSSPTTIKGAKMMARNELLTWTGESCFEAICFGKFRSCIDLLIRSLGMVRVWVDNGLWVAAVMEDRKSDSEDSALFLVRNNALKVQCEQICALKFELSLTGD